MENDMISQVLLIVLGVMIFILMILSVIFVVLRMKTKDEKQEDRIKDTNKTKKAINKTSVQNLYNKQSIMDFMEFEKIEDNMIVQKKGKRYLMVVECQGVNYDLMSSVEKIAVEEGFQQFLNTLRHPIQIYIQTRTINLENSISSYKDKIREIENKYNSMQYQYNQMKASGVYSQEELNKSLYELTKQRNLYEYGKDLVNNTEKMHLNRNVLHEKYFIIIPYYVEETGDEKYAQEEIRNMAFSELYTKAQSIIRTLSACSINGKILTSEELIELLYVAYNRDESEVFDLDKAIQAGYDELYSTSTDVYEKKIKALDELIHDRAVELANQSVEKVKSRTQQIAEDKENHIDQFVKKMAKIVLNDNKNYVGEEIANQAIEEIDKLDEEGEVANEEIKKKTVRRRKTTTK